MAFEPATCRLYTDKHTWVWQRKDIPQKLKEISDLAITEKMGHVQMLQVVQISSLWRMYAVDTTELVLNLNLLDIAGTR